MLQAAKKSKNFTEACPNLSRGTLGNGLVLFLLKNQKERTNLTEKSVIP